MEFANLIIYLIIFFDIYHLTNFFNLIFIIILLIINKLSYLLNFFGIEWYDSLNKIVKVYESKFKSLLFIKLFNRYVSQKKTEEQATQKKTHIQYTVMDESYLERLKNLNN